MTFTIYHNPRCRKSREALALLSEQTNEIQVIEYLKSPPTHTELNTIVRLLGISAEELVRKGEEEFKTLYKGKQLSEDEWIDAMILHPKLIERPIVIKGDNAILGRPPENVKDLF